MRSLGTKETQGINGDAAALQRRLDGALRLAERSSAVGGTACSYPRHRGVDWRLADDGPVVCGICHPPAGGLEVVRG